MTTHRPNARPYPRRCHACREVAVHRAEERRTVEAKYDGTQYTLTVPAFPLSRCARCGATTVGHDSDEAINRALRDHVGLLHPHEIRANRNALGLTQQQLAERLGWAPETVCRAETGAVIQSRAYDRILRAFFHLPVLRYFYEALRTNPSWGRMVTIAADETWLSEGPALAAWLGQVFERTDERRLSEWSAFAEIFAAMRLASWSAPINVCADSRTGPVGKVATASAIGSLWEALMPSPIPPEPSQETTQTGAANSNYALAA